MSAVQGYMPNRMPVLPARGTLRLLFLALLGFSACALDKETAVRAQLDGWVVLRDTLYFNSSRTCTAALFAAGAQNTLSGVAKVNGIKRGLTLIRQGQAVAFDMAGMSPADVQTAIDETDRSISLAVLASGLAARECFGDGQKDSFSKGLFGKGVVLIFDPQNSAVALFDRVKKQVFFTRAVL